MRDGVDEVKGKKALVGGVVSNDLGLEIAGLTKEEGTVFKA